MRALWVTVEQDFTAPVDRVFAHLSEHENLGEIFGAKVERLEDGRPERNGVGSRRRMRIGPTAPFEETITASSRASSSSTGSRRARRSATTSA